MLDYANMVDSSHMWQGKFKFKLEKIKASVP
jgi:hypothetical protein